jgi:tetratricopeptide (TPR) repeat protein
MAAIDTDDAEGEKLVAKAYLESIDPSETNKRESWEACREYLKLMLDKGGALTRLEELSRMYFENDDVQRYLGRAYKKYDEHDKAANAFKWAGQLAIGDDEKLADLGQAALSLLRRSRKTDAQVIVDEMKRIASMAGRGNEILLSTFREMADLDADSDAYFGLTEHMLELKPDDITKRFQLAFRYSQEKQEKLSLFHYLRIPERLREGGTWNNLGVQYGTLGLKARSIKAYRKAEQLGETLAMSNLSQSLIDAGFLEEASDICNRAIQMEDYHKNISGAITRIKELPEEEEKEEKELLKKALPYSEFFRAYGKALTVPDPDNRIETWEGPECHLRLEIRDRTFIAEGTYESDSRNLGLALPRYFGVGSAATSGPTTHHVRYAGKLTGYTVKAEVTDVEQTEEPTPSLALPTLLTSLSPVPRKTLMVVAESFTEIRVYEKEGFRFYTLKKVIL